jgi:aspartate/methionine/tyrosine aminotransferase
MITRALADKIIGELSFKTVTRLKPDISAIAAEVPISGDLASGHSELQVNFEVSREIAYLISSSRNNYGPAEGLLELRELIAEQITENNKLIVKSALMPSEIIITAGASGAIAAISHTLLKDQTTLVFEPYYPLYSNIIEEHGGRVVTHALDGEDLFLDINKLHQKCRDLKRNKANPLRAILLSNPMNPTGKVFSKHELNLIATICREFDLLCVSVESYEHFVIGEQKHISIGSLPGMCQRTFTVNSFSKSWNIADWRLGFIHSESVLLKKVLSSIQNSYHCPPLLLQRALARMLPKNPRYYLELHELFSAKHRLFTERLKKTGFQPYQSGSAFYIWAKIPSEFSDADELNKKLIAEAGVAGVPGAAFADNKTWDNYLRFCIGREYRVLESSLNKMERFFAGH